MHTNSFNTMLPILRNLACRHSFVKFPHVLPQSEIHPVVRTVAGLTAVSTNDLPSCALSGGGKRGHFDTQFAKQVLPAYTTVRVLAHGPWFPDAGDRTSGGFLPWLGAERRGGGGEPPDA